MKVIKGLIIDKPHIDHILSGRKTWEMRSTAVKIRGRIALIRKGSGQVVGTAEVVDSVGPLSESSMLANLQNHLIDAPRILSGEVDKWRFAWVLRDARTLPQPVPYVHKSGAVKWVTLDELAVRLIEHAESVRPR